MAKGAFLWGDLDKDKGTDESTLVTDSLVPLMNYDPSDLGSPILIQITPKECTLNVQISHTEESMIFTLWSTVFNLVMLI